MKLEIITPDESIYTGEVMLVQLPGLDGSFEILNNHAPLVSILKEGQIKIKTPEKQEKFFDIKGGVIEVLKNKVLILAE
ncbi:MAG: ATP synthase F1 subunit epsilon [Bacteroidales bacterium]|nr:ATP synthase F1 subunit epsilon [Bacteroidales bacterium]MCF8397451.1 ATP synthase F1 subunit epsilon [Bacteroidales bacterium]